MDVLAILGQKGGTGKTTVATNLAVAAENDNKKTVIFDLDPQATASFWKDLREEQQVIDTPAVISIQAIRLKAMIEASRENNVDLVIIDGAAVARDIILDAANVADFALLPTKPAIFDSASLIQTINIIKGVNLPASMVLNAISPVGKENQEAIDLAGSIDINICPVTIGNRKAFFKSQAKGQSVQEYEPNGKAAEEISKLYTYTCIHLKKDK